MVFYGGLKGLVWADIMTRYIMFVMTSYLTTVMNLSFTKAAAVLNLWQGSVLVLQFGLAFLVDSFMGYGPMTVISTISLTTGLGFLYISTPPVSGTCSAYKPECIGQAQKIMYYMALVQMAVGLSGHAVALFRYFRFQVEEEKDHAFISRYREERYDAFEFAIGFSIAIGVLCGTVLPTIAKKQLSLLFGIPAIFCLLAAILFFIGFRWYYPMKPEGSPFTKVVKVLTAPICRMFCRVPNRNTVEEVEETEAVVRIVPIATMLIICGLVNSIGHTYFVEQANHMNRKFGKLKVPVEFLLLTMELSKLFYYVLFAGISNCMERKGQKKYASRIAIALAMIFAILCCVTAAKVETRRLNVIINHKLVESPEATIPMSMFWLLPQFLLLAGLSSLREKGVTDFFSDQVPKSMKDYVRYFSNGVFGLGTMSSVLAVHLAGKISGKGGKTSWFQETLSKSRLDKYYWLLAVMCVANLVFYVFVISFYPVRESDESELEDEDLVETPFGLFPASTGIPLFH